MIETGVAVFAVSGFIFLLGFAAVHDVMTLTIPDWVSVALAGIFPVVALYFGFGWLHVGIGMAVALLVMVAGAVLFFLRAIGGGDVKLAAATSAWFGASGLSFVLATAIVGGVLALVWLIVSRSGLRGRLGSRIGDPEALPYGVAICAGGLLASSNSGVLSTALVTIGLVHV